MITKELIDKICEQPVFSPDMLATPVVSKETYERMQARGWIDENGCQTPKLHEEMADYLVGRFEATQAEYPDADPLDVVACVMDQVRSGQ